MEERLQGKIDIHGPDECWPWTGRKNSYGYGMLHIRYGSRSSNSAYSPLAHRVVYEQRIGEIPKGMIIRHTCHNRACCNPKHLTPGSPADNSQDMVRADRSTKGSRNPSAKLNENDVLEVRRLRAEGMTLKDISERFNVHLSTIGLVCQGKLWK